MTRNGRRTWVFRAALAAALLAFAAPGGNSLRADDKKTDPRAKMSREEAERELGKSAERLSKAYDESEKKHEELRKQVEELRKRIKELEEQRRDELYPHPWLNNFREPPPVLPNLRGQIVRVAGDQVQISVGIDAGLAVGTVLDVYRLEGGGKYLGTVKMTSALNVFPKEAILTFTPVGNTPFDRLKPDDLPKKGDEVRPQHATKNNN